MNFLDDETYDVEYEQINLITIYGNVTNLLLIICKKSLVLLKKTIFNSTVTKLSNLTHLHIPFKKTLIYTDKLFHLMELLSREHIFIHKHKLSLLCLL